MSPHWSNCLASILPCLPTSPPSDHSHRLVLSKRKLRMCYPSLLKICPIGFPLFLGFRKPKFLVMVYHGRFGLCLSALPSHQPPCNLHPRHTGLLGPSTPVLTKPGTHPPSPLCLASHPHALDLEASLNHPSSGKPPCASVSSQSAVCLIEPHCFSRTYQFVLICWLVQ